MFRNICALLEQVEKYKLSQIEAIKEELISRGEKIIDLSIGSPDIPPPPQLVYYLTEAMKEPKNHSYAPYQGLKTLRVEITNYMERRFGIKLNPDEEVLILIGSKEGIYHLPFVVLNENEYALIPDPAYPVYKNSLLLRKAKYVQYFLKEENNFQPVLDFDILKNVKLIYLNYPNNPVGNCIDECVLTQIIDIAKKYNILVVNDNAYAELVYDKKPLSILQYDKEKSNCLEFHSFSKSLSIAGWRVGWVCGNRNIIKAMLKQKAHIDSGIFPAIQIAISKIMPDFENIVEKIRKIYKNRMEIVYNNIKSKFKVLKPDGTFYLWFETPVDSEEFVKKTLYEKKVFLCPSTAFSERERNWVRLSLTTDENNLTTAVSLL